MSQSLLLRKRNAETEEVADISEQNSFACYQCGKCTAACPLAFAMDAGPHQILRYLQLGQEEKAMRSNAPWICVGCLTCAAYCPKGVDPARVMEALRTIQLRRLTAPFHYTSKEGERLARLPQSALVAAMRKVTW